jgi:hypothetical protein
MHHQRFSETKMLLLHDLRQHNSGRMIFKIHLAYPYSIRSYINISCIMASPPYKSSHTPKAQMHGYNPISAPISYLMQILIQIPIQTQHLSHLQQHLSPLPAISALNHWKTEKDCLAKEYLQKLCHKYPRKYKPYRNFFSKTGTGPACYAGPV